MKLKGSWRVLFTTLLAMLLALATLSPLSAQEAASLRDGDSPRDVGIQTEAPTYAAGRAGFSATDVPVVIPDNDPGGVTSTLEIDSQGSIADLRVHLLVSHTYVGDLIATLTHVDTGTSTVLFDRPGVPATVSGCNGNDIDAVFDDAAAIPVEDVCPGTVPAIDGSFLPIDALSGFDGENIAGTWTLDVVDANGLDTGMLDGWELSVERPVGLQVGIFGAPFGSDWNGDVAAKVYGTGKADWVGVHRSDGTVPSVGDLQAYDSVMVYKDFGYADPTALGNVLADYVDGGGGVVVAHFSWEADNTLTGRIRTDGYLPFTGSGSAAGDGPLGSVIEIPDHPLLDGFVSLTGGTSSYRGDVSVAPGAVLVASWDDAAGLPLVATKAQAAGRVVGLNFFPPSSDVRGDLWDAATDGDHLLANALTYAATPPRRCGGFVATIDGTDGNDVLNGTPGDDIFNGGNGSDTIRGMGGNDIICGGNGHDTLIGGAGDDDLRGGLGTDTAAYGGSPSGITIDLVSGVATGLGTDTIVAIENVLGSEFDDSIFGSAGPNWLRGLGGNDTIDGRQGDDVVAGGFGDDLLYGGGGDDTVDGFAGSDTLRGGPGDDLLRGWADGDVIIPAGGNDTVLGGNGTDRVDYANAPNGVIVDLAAGTASGYGNDSLGGIVNVTGSVHNDRIFGNFARNALFGAGGNDLIDGRGGNDAIDGWVGWDELIGGPGSDTILGWTGNDRIDGGTSNDTLDGEAGDDVIFGRGGNDDLFGGLGVDALWGGAGLDTCTDGEIFGSCETIAAVPAGVLDLSGLPIEAIEARRS